MKKTIISIAALLASTNLSAHNYDLGRPDSHAPYGVMGDHLHKTGEFMFSYRFMRMEMDDNAVGSDTISDAEVFTSQGFPVAPTRMTMDMHMFGAMYAPSDKLTLMAMLPLLDISMDHLVVPMNVRFTTETSGIGDIKLGGLYSLYKQGAHSVHLNASISLPTGSTDERDDTPAMANAILPYPMQLGSGTYDFLPGITYTGQSSRWSWGAQLMGTIRTGRNDEGYTLGDKLEATSWIAHKWNDSFSTSFRLAVTSWGDVDGADGRLNPNMVPTANPSLRGGDRIDALVGLNYKLGGFRLAAEVGTPIHQDLDGPQLQTDWISTIGVQYAF